MERINVGIIGTGWCGGIRAETCADSPFVNELHIAETNPDRRADEDPDADQHARPGQRPGHLRRCPGLRLGKLVVEHDGEFRQRVAGAERRQIYRPHL